MLIILEGPDACGKTTLAEEIKKQMPAGYVKYFHHTYVKGKAPMWEYFCNSLHEAEKLIRAGHVVVFDRFWPSEIVYAQVYRKGSLLKAHCRALDRWVRKLGGQYVWCVPSDVEIAVTNHAKMSATRSEFYKPDEKIRQVAEKFKEIFEAHDQDRTFSAKLNYVTYGGALTGMNSARQATYSFDKHNPIAKAVELVDNAYTRSSEVGRLVHIQNAVGECGFGNVKALIVGDKYSGIKSEKARPFISFRGASGYLNEILERNKINEDGVLYTNANNEHFDLVLNYCVDNELFDLKIITLGGEARKKVKSLTCYSLTSELVHPAFAKRFTKDPKSKNFEANLVKALKN